MSSKIRAATSSDIAAMLEIYNPYILQTTITFETEKLTFSAFCRRFSEISAIYPWLVYEQNGKILGYAYAAKPFSDRAAYAWDVDLSIYLDRCCQHIGIGSCLYEKLEAILKDLGYHNLYALITSENDISKQFHRKHGFTPVGVMKNSGMKFDRWISVEWYEKSICEPIIPIQPPIPISDYPIIPTFFPDLP